MSEHVCPFWLGYLLINPLRRLIENPEKMLGEFIRDGMVVLEPGPGMGYFTIPLARMVGPKGRVVAVDLQEKMLNALESRAKKAGLFDRLDLRLAGSDRLGIDDLAGKVDFATAIHVVHETPDASAFLAEIFAALKPEARLLVIEPRGHVSKAAFDKTLSQAKQCGFTTADPGFKMRGRAALLSKPAQV